MKTRLLITIGIIIIIVVSLSSFLLHENVPEKIIQESIVKIPKGSYVVDNNLTFEPEEITVIIGVNNTVRWINQEPTPVFINSINGNWTQLKINPNESEFLLFQDPGIYEYFGHPWMHGKVVVLEFTYSDEQICEEGHTIVNGICMPKRIWDSSDFRGLQTGESISNPEVAIILQSLGAILIVLFIVIYTIKKRMKKKLK